jgi:hypothetical protein
MKRQWVLPILLALGACTGPAFVPHPENGIELRWPNGQGTVEAARADAGAICARRGQQAVLDSEFMDQDETLARFYCR